VVLGLSTGKRHKNLQVQGSQTPNWRKIRLLRGSLGRSAVNSARPRRRGLNVTHRITTNQGDVSGGCFGADLSIFANSGKVNKYKQTGGMVDERKIERLAS
jgi:hypothetical protein